MESQELPEPVDPFACHGATPSPLRFKGSRGVLSLYLDVEASGVTLGKVSRRLDALFCRACHGTSAGLSPHCRGSRLPVTLLKRPRQEHSAGSGLKRFPSHRLPKNPRRVSAPARGGNMPHVTNCRARHVCVFFLCLCKTILAGCPTRSPGGLTRTPRRSEPDLPDCAFRLSFSLDSRADTGGRATSQPILSPSRRSPVRSPFRTIPPKFRARFV